MSFSVLHLRQTTTIPQIEDGGIRSYEVAFNPIFLQAHRALRQRRRCGERGRMPPKKSRADVGTVPG